MARLLSNIPLLKSGFPPLIISQKKRKEYIQLLANHQIEVGVITTRSRAWTENKYSTEFKDFCIESYRATYKLIENAQYKKSR